MVWNRDLIGHFADISTYKCEGLSPLLIQCGNYGSGYTVDSFRALLSVGASLNERDDQARTCLHHCIFNLWHSNVGGFQPIKYLVDSGADPFATDNGGVSVAEYAYLFKN